VVNQNFLPILQQQQENHFDTTFLDKSPFIFRKHRVTVAQTNRNVTTVKQHIRMHNSTLVTSKLMGNGFTRQRTTLVLEWVVTSAPR
jgi:hypothetical protein